MWLNHLFDRCGRGTCMGDKLDKGLVDVEKARRREHHLVETDTECAVCHHHTHTDSETDSVNDWKPLKEFACPKCGQHAL